MNSSLLSRPMSAIGGMEGRQGRWKRGSRERLRTSQDPCRYCPARNKHQIVHGILTWLTDKKTSHGHTHGRKTDTHMHTHTHSLTPDEMLTITHYDIVSSASLPKKNIHGIRESKGYNPVMCVCWIVFPIDAVCVCVHACACVCIGDGLLFLRRPW